MVPVWGILRRIQAGLRDLLSPVRRTLLGKPTIWGLYSGPLILGNLLFDPRTLNPKP